MSLSDLPTLGELQATRRATQKGPTRLEVTMAEKKLTVVDEKAFRKAVIARDGHICRCCGRKVIRTLARVPERLEVHHCHGRRGDLRFEDRAALVVCCECHEKLTGKVNEKLVIVPTQTFTMRDPKHPLTWTYTDARFPITCRKAA